jgi:hypothetical protein
MCRTGHGEARRARRPHDYSVLGQGHGPGKRKDRVSDKDPVTNKDRDVICLLLVRLYRLNQEPLDK